MKTVRYLIFVFVVVGSASVSAVFSQTPCGTTDYTCLIAKATKDIAANPNDFEAYYNRAQAFRDDAKYDQAITDYTRYIASNPTNKEYLADGYHGRGLAYKLKGSLVSAIADYTKALQLVSNNPAIYYNRGRAYAVQKSYDLAISDFDRAIALKPDYSGYLIDRAHSYMGKLDYDRAFVDLTEAIRLDKNDPEAYYNRAKIYTSRKEYQKAINDLDIYITLNNSNIQYLSDGYQNRAINYSALGNDTQAVKDLTSAIDLDPKDPSPYKSRAIVYRRLGKVALAVLDEQKAASLPKQ